MRALSLLGLLAVFAVGPVAARAQDDEANTSQDVKVTAVLIAGDGAARADVTRTLMGLRRGLREVRGVRYVDATDLFDAEDVPAEVVDGLAELDRAAEAIRKGDGAKVQKKLRAVVETFERNLEVVKRSELVDAYLLLALTECGGAATGCDVAIERVAAFREDFDYDVTRYPEGLRDRVERVRAKFLDAGARGSMEIKAEPEGAEIFVDGRSYGPTPAVVPGLLAGAHYVTAKALGFGKKIVRVEVRGDDVAQVMVELPGSERALLLENDLPRIELELGQRRAGKAVAGMAAYLYAGQVVVGTVHRGDGDDVELALYLYDLRTRFLLAQQEAKVTHDDDMEKRARDLALKLYDGVDRTGAVAAPVDDVRERESDGATPFYAAWWFWTAVGVVAVSGGVAIGFAVSSPSGDNIPSGWTRVGGVIE